MNIVIVGAGRFGGEITKQLSKEGHNIIVIDTNPDNIENSVNEFDVNGFLGSGASFEVLKNAGCEGYDFLIAVTGNDEINILSCIVAKHLKIKNTIARIRNKQYTKQFKIMRDEFGIDFAINPDIATASRIYSILKFPGADQIETFAHGRVEVCGVKIKNNPTLLTNSLYDLREKYKIPFLVCVVKRNDEIFIPKGDFTLQEGDFAFFTADTQSMIESFKRIGSAESRMKNVFIVGGGRTGHYLAEFLLNDRIDVKVFEKDQDRCVFLSDNLPNALIIKSDGMDTKNLMEEGFEKADSLVAVTGSDENNIVVSAYAKKFNIKKVITKISNIDYDLVADTLGLDSIVSPKDIFASSVVRFVRGKESIKSRSSELKNLYRFLANRVEACEFEVSKPTEFTSIPLAKLKIKPSTIIFAILRGNDVITPKGNDTLEVGDRVFIMSTGEPVSDLSDLF